MCLALLMVNVAIAQQKPAILVLTERGGQHEGFVQAALDWLNTLVETQGLALKVINSASDIDDSLLSQCSVFVQLNYPPYSWNEKSMTAFVKYIEEGKGGWVGFHHATLLGDFDGYPMWKWFSEFMGGIRFKNYIAPTASGTVLVENPQHPVMTGLSTSFTLPADEWYTFDRSPRLHVKVLAHVDENSYQPPSDIKMGDHPVVWVNENVKARNVYFLMGHDARLFESDDFKKMFYNALIWTSHRQPD